MISAMNKMDQIKMAFNEVLLSSIDPQSKVEQLLFIIKCHKGSIKTRTPGWMECRVKEPELNTYIDILYLNGTKEYEKLCTPGIILKLRRQKALWKIAIH